MPFTPLLRGLASLPELARHRDVIFFFQAEDGIRGHCVTGVQTCALPILHTDLLGDRAFRLLPVTDLDAGRMWRSLRGAPLLTGYRGTAPVDVGALEDLLLRVGRIGRASCRERG